MKLEKALLADVGDTYSSSDKSQSCWNAKGSYNSMQFVLRLRPDIHRKLESIPSGISTASTIGFDGAQAFSTYFHETIHWWQHSGSTVGLMLSLTHPAQNHINHKHLIKFVEDFGKKKSIARHDLLNSNKNDTSLEKFRNVNRILNNFFDIEFCKHLIVSPSNAEQIVNNPYFECVGHSYSMTWGAAIWLLSSTFDPTLTFFPNVRKWEPEFKKLRDSRVQDFYYGSRVQISPIGARELFEGQARFSQIQYLYFASGGSLGWEEFRSIGMLSGIYVSAFETFLKILNSSWPEKADDPLVGLFLAVCDISINPSDGFPFDLYHFESFVSSVDPGIRFLMLCQSIATEHQELKKLVKNYSAAEYDEICDKLCKKIVCETPLSAAKKFCEWAANQSSLIAVLKEEEDFKFSEANQPVRVLFSTFLRFQAAKLKNPEYFCWPGAWSAGTRCSDAVMKLFSAHEALFVDKADGDIYPRVLHDKEEKNVQAVFDDFYVWNVIYDLSRQWILHEGAFDFDYFWLSSKHSREQMKRWASHNFELAYGFHPDDFEFI